MFNDFAYIQFEDMNCFVVASSSDYKVAIVNMDTLDVSYVMLKDIHYEGRRSSRQVEWAEGTKYVWIGGRSDDEAYVIDLETKEIVRTFTEVDARKLLSVSPYHFMGMANDYATYFQEKGSFVSETSISSYMQSQSLDSDDNDALSIVALALSCIAIAAVVASLFANKRDKPDANETVVRTEAAKAPTDESKKSYGIPSVN